MVSLIPFSIHYYKQTEKKKIKKFEFQSSANLA